MSDTRSLRVLHVSSTYPPLVIGGAEKVVAQLAEGQAERGMTVAAAYLSKRREAPGGRHGVATLPQPNRNLIWMQDVLQRPRPMRTANKLHQMINLRTAQDFAAAIAAFRPDIVHTHSMVELPPQIWALAAQQDVRVVHTLHDYDLICSRATLFRNGANCVRRHPSCRILGGWKGRFARHIDGVAAVSSPVLAAHRAHGLFDELDDARRCVIWNAVSTSDVPLDAARRSLRTGPFTFGFLGRLVPEKGLETLLRACRHLSGSDWQLQVAGHSPDGLDRWKALAQGLPVSFVGFVEPTAFLDTLDMLVVPSIWREPFGLTIVEAFSRGVPVLGADHGAIAELVGSVCREWLTPPGDVPALAQIMARAIAAGRAALPDCGVFAPVLETASADRMLDAYTRLYVAVLASSPSILTRPE